MSGHSKFANIKHKKEKRYVHLLELMCKWWGQISFSLFSFLDCIPRVAQQQNWKQPAYRPLWPCSIRLVLTFLYLDLIFKKK